MKRIFLFVAFAVSFLCRVSAESKVYEVKSPDKKISFSFKVDDNRQLIYKVAVAGKDIIDWSETGYSYGQEDAPCSLFLGAWRVLMVGKTPGDLVDSHLIELLNPDPYTV